ncbi:MAG: carboxypeptidase-like regulatory domain-containing protein, partial [Bacteroidota bacterium]
MKPIITFLFLFTALITFGQTQNVRGKVMDSETNFPLAGAKVEIDLKNENGTNYRAVTDAEGAFSIPAVPVGKYSLTTKYIQYEPKTQTIEINSGKELILSILLQESVTNKEEVVVTGRKKGEIINELAVISAQQFSVEETNRYPGSRMDPARMASNFAGVQGADDSRNDIIIRGNSPLGVVWRVEGIDIPNPNHFAIAGSSGGPVSVLNNKILGNSDFIMSAFPAEYGNSVSGVFDLKLRSGNDQRHEFTGQFGLFGTEFLAEGPLNKKGTASFLMMGRYSTLSLFEVLGIQLGTDAIPTYGDVAFKFNFKLRKGGNLS